MLRIASLMMSQAITAGMAYGPLQSGWSIPSNKQVLRSTFEGKCLLEDFDRGDSTKSSNIDGKGTKF